MLLKIRDTKEKKDDKQIELWLEYGIDNTVYVKSSYLPQHEDPKTEFIIYPTGKWVKVQKGWLDDNQHYDVYGALNNPKKEG